MIDLRNISKDYVDDENVTTALKNISFKIEKGEFVSIMGPSGSGKSTLLHILSLFDRQTGGEYFFNGKNTASLSDEQLARLRNKTMGFVFQAFNLLGRSPVFENVELPLLYSDIPKEQRRKTVLRSIDAVGLGHKTDVVSGKLSGGEKQRVAIARALVNDPDLIFADEPTGNLDSKSGAQVMSILHDLNENGKTIILVTHETYTARFAKRLIQLKDGELINDEIVKDRRNAKDEFIK
jgi:putative ABC transport system ATP-binding protein